MNILVAKNGSQLGPFSENDVRAKLASGEFAPTDYGWHEGLPAWSPLAQLLANVPPPSPAQPPYSPQGQPYGAPQPYNSPYPSPYQPGATPPWGAQGSRGYAGFWLRFVAYIIDAVLLYIPLVILMFFVGLVLGIASGSRHVAVNVNHPAFTGLILLVEFLYLFVVWFYFAGMESSGRQATFGKQALGMKVTDLNGDRITFGQATGRFFGKILSGIFLIGYIMAAFTERKQALHDMMANTLVVLK